MKFMNTFHSFYGVPLVPFVPDTGGYVPVNGGGATWLTWNS